MAKEAFEKEVDVLKYQREKVSALDESCSNLINEIDDFELRINEFLSNQNIDKTKIPELVVSEKIEIFSLDKDNNVNKKKFDDLVDLAKKSGFSDVDIYEIATQQEINETNQLLKRYYLEFTDKHKLDKYDYAFSGIVGTIAALLDFFLVTKVDGNNVVPGKLKSGVEEFWNKLISDKKNEDLEKEFKVSYDISLNTSKISEEILGLCPSYHRFQSLGHDPLIGLVVGVADLMKGQLTAIDGNGRFIIQSVNDADVKSLINAIITVFGHFLSDVNAKSKSGKILSVPAPLTPLLQLIQKGSIEYKGQNFTVADLSKRMYYDGYNFNHFIGMSIPVLLIEVLLRLYFVVKEIFFSDNDVTMKNSPRLNMMLFMANSILFSENIGKLAITQNPFSINYVSWIATAKYGFKTLKWVAYDKEIGKIDQAQGYIDNEWYKVMMSAYQLKNNIPIYHIE